MAFGVMKLSIGTTEESAGQLYLNRPGVPDGP